MSFLNKLRIGFILTLLVCFVLAVMRTCHKLPETNIPAKDTTLKPGEKEKVSIDMGSNTVAITTPRGVDVRRGVRNVTVTEDEDGDIQISAKEYGFTFEPGLSAFASSGRGRLGLDAGVFYYRDFDVLVGFGVNPSRVGSIVGVVGIGWTPPVKLLSNTDLWIGVDTNKSPAFGVRVAF